MQKERRKIVRPPKFCVGDQVRVCVEDSSSPSGIGVQNTNVQTFRRAGKVRRYAFSVHVREWDKIVNARDREWVNPGIYAFNLYAV